MLQMDTQLAAMNGVVKASFSVKDLLDLPEHRDPCNGGTGSPAMTGPADLTSVVSGPDGGIDVGGHSAGVTAGSYYDPDNPYTRWLQTNEAMAPYAGTPPTL